MRLRAVAFAVLAVSGVAASAWQIGLAGAGYFEERTADELRAILDEAGLDWAGIATDGLVVTLSGEAPDEGAHLRAVEVLHGRVGVRRLEDAITLAARPPSPPPAFALELLRNRDEVSLMGLVPGAESGARIHAALTAAGVGGDIADMLEIAEHPAPEGWDDSLTFGLDLLAAMPRARIVVEPGTVTVTGALADDGVRAATAAALAAAAPEGVVLNLDLSAPRPVIAPYRLEFALDADGGRFIACAAETEAEVAQILDAARALAPESADEGACMLGLGAPTGDWTEAVTLGLAALGELGGGQFALVDSHAHITAPAGVAPAALDALAAELAGALPAAYLLTVVAPEGGEGAEGQAVYAPRFDAVLGADGQLELQGAVHDAVSQAAIQSYAAALFGHHRVSDAMVIDPRLPDGWPVRVLAGIQALAEVTEGRLEVTPDGITLSGRSIDAETDARVEAMLAAKAAGTAEVDVRYDARAAARAAELARPAPERCAGEIGAILETEMIVFRPGSAVIDPVSSGVIAAIGDVLRECPGAAFEVGGHTDSSGNTDTNQRLSESRAAAVVAALRAEDLPLIDFHAAGHGADQPRADNATPEGRALNRRIEIVLHDPEAAAAARREAALREVIADGRILPLPAGGACPAEIARILGEEPIEFELGSARISPESADVIAAMAETLRDCGAGQTFEIAGHTDDRGPAEVNQRLSEERAAAVVAALTEAEIEGIEFIARGYGPDRPVAGNDTAEGRARNRRIEVALAPAQETEPETGADASPEAAPEAETDPEPGADASPETAAEEAPGEEPGDAPEDGGEAEAGNGQE